MKNIKDTKKAEILKDKWIIASQQAGVYPYLDGVLHREKVKFRTILNKFGQGYMFINKW